MKKTYIALVFGVIAGVYCRPNKELELTDKEASSYLKKKTIKRKEDETEETISATSTTVEEKG